MTDEEYFEFVQSLAPFYPIDEGFFLDEDSAFGWSADPDWDEIDLDAEIE